MKKILILFFLFLCADYMFAQDVIVKKDGSTILSKVLEVNPSNVKYKKSSNLNGPTYSIDISDLLSINYENGDKDCFATTTLPDGSNKTSTKKWIYCSISRQQQYEVNRNDEFYARK